MQLATKNTIFTIKTY